MDTQNNLSNYLNQDGDRSNTPTTQPSTPSYGAFLNVFSINLVHRFPDITNLDRIDATVIENVARFSAVCSTIGLNVWDDIWGSEQQQRRQRAPQRTTRAA